jgi:cob(I)alamin adenosyltransferase
VQKSHIRIEAYGDLDELNSVIGALAATLPDKGTELIEEIHRIQSDLLHVGAWLATTPDSPSLAVIEEITADRSKFLEKAIDRMECELPPIKTFILPGGHISAAWAHLARTVCRRTERHVVRLVDKSNGSQSLGQLNGVLMYLNRLSDYLFVLARFCNRIQGVTDALWKK